MTAILVPPSSDILSRTLTFVLAGGEGRRLTPLTMERPKPLIPFGGVYRILDFTLSNCLNSGLRRLYVLTQYRPESLHDYLRLGWNGLTGRPCEFAVPRPAASGKYYRGTADAVLQNLHLLEPDRSSIVLVLSADHIYKMDYRPLLRFHVERGAEATIGTVRYPVAKASEFGQVQTDFRGRVVGFEEKRPGTPSDSGDTRVNMGIYVFNAETLQDVAKEFACRPSLDFGQDVIPWLIQARHVDAYHFEDETGLPGYWRDVGTIQAYFDTSMEFVRPNPPFDPFDAKDSWPIRVGNRFQSWRGNLLPGKGTDPARSIIPHGAVIEEAEIHGSIVSHGVCCQPAAYVRDSILMPGAYVGRGASLHRTIVDEYARVADGDQIGYDLEKDRKRFNVTSDGIVVVGLADILRAKPREIHLATRAVGGNVPSREGEYVFRQGRSA